MRESPFHDPGVSNVELATLVGYAAAIEQDALHRYRELAQTMRERGQLASAEAFDAMADEEAHHADAVTRWAARLGQRAQAPAAFEGRVAQEFAPDWDEIRDSALLTPYRAFATAVRAEMRAFRFYSYLAAHAHDEVVRKEAEKMASEELRHAALMRSWRRRAWHRERRPTATARPFTDAAALHAAIAQFDATEPGSAHAAADELERLGDADSAVLVRSLATPLVSSAPAPTRGHAECSMPADEDSAPSLTGSAASAAILLQVQRRLELLGERLEATLESADPSRVALAEPYTSEVFRRIALVAARVAERTTAIPNRSS